MISELKYIWDNFLQGNPKLLVILCGSSPSFMINKVVHSKSLYNRSQHEFHLKPLTLSNSSQLLKFSSEKQKMDAYLMVGGIPEYLNYMKGESTAQRCISMHSFLDGGVFLSEYKKIFISSLSKNKNYKIILEFIAKHYSCTSEEISNALKIKKLGTFKRIMQDLIQCGFISKVTPLGASMNSTLVKYEISDNYLHFYYDFIKPKETRIRRGDFRDSPFDVLNSSTISQWLGYAFERYLRQNPQIIAKILEFSGIEYEAGAYFNRSTGDSKMQIDLAYKRKDKVLTICEVKYTETPTGISVIREFEAKIGAISSDILNDFEVQKVLVSREGATKELIERGYFDRIISLEDIWGIGA